jgi:hypothetical protein
MERVKIPDWGSAEDAERASVGEKAADRVRNGAEKVTTAVGLNGCVPPRSDRATRRLSRQDAVASNLKVSFRQLEAPKLASDARTADT